MQPVAAHCVLHTRSRGHGPCSAPTDMCPLHCQTASFNTGLSYGGPVVCIFGWLAVSFVMLCVALGMAELASAYPTSGGEGWRLPWPQLQNRSPWSLARLHTRHLHLVSPVDARPRLPANQPSSALLQACTTGSTNWRAHGWRPLRAGLQVCWLFGQERSSATVARTLTPPCVRPVFPRAHRLAQLAWAGGGCVSRGVPLLWPDIHHGSDGCCGTRSGAACIHARAGENGCMLPHAAAENRPSSTVMVMSCPISLDLNP